MSIARFPRVLLVTDRRRTGGRDLAEVVALAFAGGIRFVQVRERDQGDEEVRRWLERIRAAAPAGTLVAVNGRAGVARDLGAGLHLPAAAALPDTSNLAFWGRSAHGEGEVLRAVREGADYVVVGTAFPTASKPSAPTLGIEGVARLAGIAGARPVFAIGGVDAARAGALRKAGIHGVAVCSAVLEAPDPAAAAQDLIEAAGRD